MSDSTSLTRSERKALEDLPWYVNGTLDAGEREHVRRELRSSLTCRLEYERLCRMRDLMQQDDAETVATDRGFERLMARIETSGKARRGLAPTQQPSRRWLPVAQAAALVLAAGVAWWWSATTFEEPGPYTTLTAEPPPQALAPQLRLVFAPGVTEAEKQAILAKHGLSLAAAPTAEGLYTLTLPAEADARRVADLLRADAKIAFVTTPAEKPSQ
jgi:hypothetical protein